MLPVVGRAAEVLLRLVCAGAVIPQIVDSGALRVGTTLRRRRSRARPGSLARLLGHRRADRLILLLHVKRGLALARFLIEHLGTVRRRHLSRLVLIALLIETLLSHRLSHVRILWLLLHDHLRLGLSGYLISAFPSLPLLKHVQEFLVNVLDLAVAEAEGLPVDEAADSVELVHEHEVLLLVIVVDGADVLLEQRIVQLIVATLLQLQIQDAAANLEEVLDDVLALSTILAGLRVHLELVAVLTQHLGKRPVGIINRILLKEVQLCQHVNNVDLVVGRDVSLDHLAVLLIE